MGQACPSLVLLSSGVFYIDVCQTWDKPVLSCPVLSCPAYQTHPKAPSVQVYPCIKGKNLLGLISQIEEMAITGKLVREFDIKGGGNFLHHIFKQKANEIATISPNKVQSCDLVSGQWGAPGSVISWRYIHDGKVNTAKEIIEAADDETQTIVYKVIEGDVMQVYDALTLTVHFEETGNKHLGVWSVDFQKANASIPDPTPYLDLLCDLTKDMDAYNLKLQAAA
ncbi:hypothetical protein OSB04_021795 [Centaurea solstitialis]|uniref:Bet v I/Major latex protein domain-containing protein n=1 Tax=Centaurea solstitialis TaxID=347529 RepID=A0AA38TD90_9ASTR|nr:hypothetical protein OSB04_021795 [Centaurea solstitialis]